MTGNFFAADVGDVLSAAITEASPPVYVVDPARESIRELVGRLHGAADPPAVNLLADEDCLKGVLSDYVVAGRAADLAAAETLSLRTDETGRDGALLVSQGRVVSLVDLPAESGGLTATESPFVDEALSHYRERWDGADQFALRSPPISRVRETLAGEVGDGAAADFDAIVEALPSVDEDGLDEVTVALLVAARHGVQLYDISRWGEDIGLASKATFSRKKGRLEDAGVVTTEKVPIDVGRPRLRLRLATDDLRAADVSELIELVRERVGDR